jgi:circadian clock protein KaiC
MESELETLTTGVEGLDELLNGGLVAGRLYLVAGDPGTGKTLVGMEFLQAGLERDETVLFVHSEESEKDLRANAREVGIDIDGAEFLDLGPGSDVFKTDQSYDLVDPHDVEAGKFVDQLRDAIEEVDPDRVVIDPITQLEYIEPTDYQFRERLISFMRYLKEGGATVLATKTMSPEYEDEDIRSLSDGIVRLELTEQGRRIAVPKHRGVGQRDGTHGLEISGDGIKVFTSIVPERHRRDFTGEKIPSGVEAFDELLGGGIERGTTTFITGPTGVGKTTTGTQFLVEAAQRGENALLYTFEESLDTFLYRSTNIGLPVDELMEDGSLTVEAVEPLSLSPEEFASRIRKRVEEEDVQVVMIDGIDGYKVSVQGEDELLTRKIHALGQYLNNVNVTTLIMDATDQVTGMPQATSADVSYLADNIVFLNYLELDGELRKVAGVLKKRVGSFEHTLREYAITEDGLVFGGRLTGVTGVLQGVARRHERTGGGSLIGAGERGSAEATPPSGGETTRSPSGGETTRSPSGGETTRSPSGGETTRSPSGGGTTGPASGTETTKSPSGAEAEDGHFDHTGETDSTDDGDE